MFTPIPLADGGYFGVIGGTYGPGTYAVTANDFGLPVEMPMPAFATGIILQAVTDVQYYTDQESAATAALPLTLTAGSYMRMQGADAVGKLCIVIGASTSFVLQYTQGEGGVPPAFFLASTSGGITPPPPPGIGAIPTINVVHVMKFEGGQGGNDATAARNRLDLPALTITRAEELAQPGDAIVVWPGDYNEGDLGTVDGITYMLINARIYAFDGAGNSNAFAVNGIGIRFTGNGSVSMEGAGGAALAVFNGGSATGTVDLTGFDGATGLAVASGAEANIIGNVDTRQGPALSCGEGTLELTGSAHSDDQRGAYSTDPAAVLKVNGDVSSNTSWGALCLEGTMRINGNVVSGGAIASAECNNGSMVVTGDAINTANGRGVNMNGTGTAEVRGDARSVDSNGAACSGGTLTVYGETYSENSSAWFITNGTCNINGASIAPNNTGILIPSGSPTVRCKNNINAAGGAGITVQTLTADVQLYGGCYIESGGESVLGDLGSPVPIRSYGATGNSATDNVTVTGTFNVVP